MTVEVRKFTDAQLKILGEVFGLSGRGPDALEWLYEHYHIRLTNFVHDEYVLVVPDGITEEDADVIVAEVRTLFG